MSSMERPPSIFAEVAEKSKAKRAQMDRSTVARAAKRVKDGEDQHAERSIKFAADFERLGQHAERSIKFAADFERLGQHAKGISVPNASDPDMQNPRCELGEVAPKANGQNGVSFKTAPSPTVHFEERSQIHENLWDSLRRSQER